ncbi:MAG: DUF3330 domain-containing protein [Gammaproteobacteria bacterium]|jgi:hypothetical protein|nr:DUF3330 domain-containing protein [Gammaproteobacteria bacterium]
MSKPDRLTGLTQVACEVCLKEIPGSEVPIEEAGDYVMYFCGLDCYSIWREKYTREREE